MKQRRRERGQALVEFALVATAFFMTMLGIFEVGRLCAYWISMQQGAQEAARSGSLGSATEAQIVTTARNQTAFIGGGLANCSADVLSACTSGTGGVKVSCASSSGGTPVQCANGDSGSHA